MDSQEGDRHYAGAELVFTAEPNRMPSWPLGQHSGLCACPCSHGSWLRQMADGAGGRWPFTRTLNELPWPTRTDQASPPSGGATCRGQEGATRALLAARSQMVMATFPRARPSFTYWMAWGTSISG